MTLAVSEENLDHLDHQFTWTTGEDDEEHKMSLRDEELMADLTMEELKQAFR